MVTPEDSDQRAAASRARAGVATHPERQRARRPTLWRAPGIALLTVPTARERSSSEDFEAAPRDVSTAEG
ncbi:MAG: hypothetical protein ACLFU0_07585 [Alphaproteobacteria bacterium]